MKIILNGKERILEEPCTVLQLIEQVGQHPQRVAVQLNADIIKREAYAQHTLQDGDVVEMLQFVGGGSVTRFWDCHSERM